MTLLGTKRISVTGLLFPDFPTPPYPISTLEAKVQAFSGRMNLLARGKAQVVAGSSHEWIMMPKPLSDPIYETFRRTPDDGLLYFGTKGRALIDDAYVAVGAALSPSMTDAVAVAIHGMGNCGMAAGFMQYFSAGPFCGFSGSSYLPTLLHETAGHSWGQLLHSSSLDCWQKSGHWAPPDLLDHFVGAVWQGYGDGDDPQGAGGLGPWHCENQLKMGWLDPAQIITAEQGNHTYTLAPLEAGQGVVGLRIPLPDCPRPTWYFLEYRTQSLYGPGVYVRMYQDPHYTGSYATDTFLLKMQAGSGYQFWRLPERVSMGDPYRGVRFTLKARTESGATIQVRR